MNLQNNRYDADSRQLSQHRIDYSAGSSGLQPMLDRVNDFEREVDLVWRDPQHPCSVRFRPQRKPIALRHG
jgi:hypothetical protein